MQYYWMYSRLLITGISLTVSLMFLTGADDDDPAGIFTNVKDRRGGSEAEPVNSKAEASKRWSFLYLAIFFSIAISILYFTYSQFPALDE